MNMNMDDIKGREATETTMSYQGLVLTLKEVQALFRFEKTRRARVSKEMRRVANVVANRAGKKDPVFKRPVKIKGPRKTKIEKADPFAEGPYSS